MRSPAFLRLSSVILVTPLLLLFSGCAYLETWAKQSYYRFKLRQSPGLSTSRHLLDQTTYFVFGRVTDSDTTTSGHEMAVVALSSSLRSDEIVDLSQTVRPGSYYGLNLPPGDYTLAAFCDRNDDRIFEAREVIATTTLHLEKENPEKVRGGIDLGRLENNQPIPDSFQLRVQPERELATSLFYPKGTLRRLDDPIFSPAMASLGLYQPAAFIEQAPMMFYALEEDTGYKVPVIFVHGIGGSAREFEDIVSHLDRTRYVPLFFHYPSGGDLHQLGALFYEIFLSGKTIPKNENPVVIVAHSMGGLVVREAFNHYRGDPHEVSVGALLTISSPMGGHPAAARAAGAPVVLPAWRNLDPRSSFIANLHRTPLPAAMKYTLFTTSGHDSNRNTQATDGVVPLSSQRAAAALAEAQNQADFACSHTEVLHNIQTVERIESVIESVKNVFPEDHLRLLSEGGYNITLNPQEFSPLERHWLSHFGKYFDALVDGRLKPIRPVQTTFVEECHNRKAVDSPLAKAWLFFDQRYPDRPRP